MLYILLYLKKYCELTKNIRRIKVKSYRQTNITVPANGIKNVSIDIEPPYEDSIIGSITTRLSKGRDVLNVINSTSLTDGTNSTISLAIQSKYNNDMSDVVLDVRVLFL